MASAKVAAVSKPPLDAKPLHLLHNPGLATEWTAEEQSILDENLHKFSSDTNFWKYVKLAALLPKKHARDVALRCRWIAMKKENGKKRRAEDLNASRKAKDKKERDATGKAKPMCTPPLPTDNDDGISNEAIDGAVGELFEKNMQLIVQIRANLVAGKARENVDLFVSFRENLLTVVNGMKVPGAMGQMPPLPVSINSELADALLHTNV